MEKHNADGELRVFPTFDMQGVLPEVEFFFPATEQISLDEVISGTSHHERYEGGNMWPFVFLVLLFVGCLSGAGFAFSSVIWWQAFQRF